MRSTPAVCRSRADRRCSPRSASSPGSVPTIVPEPCVWTTRSPPPARYASRPPRRKGPLTCMPCWGGQAKGTLRHSRALLGWFDRRALREHLPRRGVGPHPPGPRLGVPAGRAYARAVGCPRLGGFRHPQARGSGRLPTQRPRSVPPLRCAASRRSCSAQISAGSLSLASMRGRRARRGMRLRIY
jgi:hypothetical protein